jgi:hypothetical protein
MRCILAIFQLRKPGIFHFLLDSCMHFESDYPNMRLVKIFIVFKCCAFKVTAPLSDKRDKKNEVY